MAGKLHQSLTYLTSCVDDLSGVLLVLVLNNLAESILNGGVVALDKVSVNKLNGERRFAYSKRSALKTKHDFCLELGNESELKIKRVQHTDRATANDSNLSLFGRSRDHLCERPI